MQNVPIPQTQVEQKQTASGSRLKRLRKLRERRDAFVALNDYLESPDRLAGDKSVAIPLDNRSNMIVGSQPMAETTEHREIVYLRMLGYTATEIATEVRKTPATIRKVLDQPWARKRIIDNMQQSHATLGQQLERSALRAFILLDAQMDDPDCSTKQRADAARFLFEHFMGKPTQRVEMDKREIPADANALRAELAQLEAEEKRLRGN